MQTNNDAYTYLVFQAKNSFYLKNVKQCLYVYFSLFYKLNLTYDEKKEEEINNYLLKNPSLVLETYYCAIKHIIYFFLLLYVIYGIWKIICGVA